VDGTAVGNPCNCTFLNDGVGVTCISDVVLSGVVLIFAIALLIKSWVDIMPHIHKVRVAERLIRNIFTLKNFGVLKKVFGSILFLWSGSLRLIIFLMRRI
jgi:hypothetical protein